MLCYSTVRTCMKTWETDGSVQIKVSFKTLPVGGTKDRRQDFVFLHREKCNQSLAERLAATILCCALNKFRLTKI